MNLSRTIEAILFIKGEPVKITTLVKLLGKKEGEVHEAIRHLTETLQERGIVVVRVEDTVTLGTSPEAKDIIQNIQKEEVSGPLTKPALETLSVILYRKNVTKSEIDYIRGVNSQFILRNLLVRGLIEKNPHPTDKRAFVYTPTVDLLSHLGVTRVEELPDFEEYTKKVEEGIATAEKEEDQ